MVYITIIPWAQVGHNHFISNKGKWNNCFSKFSNRVFPPIFISTILQSARKENLAHYFLYEVKLRLLAHSLSFVANQKARNAIVGAENLLKADKLCGILVWILWVFFQHPKPINHRNVWNSEDMQFFHGFTGTITHSWLANQSACIDGFWLLY